MAQEINVLIPVYDDKGLCTFEGGGTPYGGAEFTTYVVVDSEEEATKFSDYDECLYKKAKLIIEDEVHHIPAKCRTCGGALDVEMLCDKCDADSD